MENNGWIKLHKKITNWEWYGDNIVRSVFIHLLLTASHNDYKWKGILVKKGEVITGYPSLAKKLGLSVQNVRTAFRHLKSTGEITVKSTSKYSVVTIQNYDTYQQANSQTNSQLTGNQQATNNNQEYKEYKNIKNNIASESATPPLAVQEKLLEEKSKEKKVKVYQRRPPEKATPLQSMVYFLEDALKTRITNWGKQATAYDLILKAGYTDDNIRGAILYMRDDDPFFRDKPFDLMTVMNQLPRYQAIANKESSQKGGDRSDKTNETRTVGYSHRFADE